MKRIFLTALLLGLIFLIGCQTEPVFRSEMKVGALNYPYSAGVPAPLSTVQPRAELIATVTADATALAVDTMNWTDCLALFVPIPAEWNFPGISFYGYGDGDGAGDPCDSTFSFDVYVCDYLGGAECVVSGSTGTIGAQQLSHVPYTGTTLNDGDPNTDYCWADNLNEGTDKWSTTLYYSDYQSTDGRAKMRFDRHEAYGLYVRIYDMTAQSVTSITAVMTGF